MFKITKTNGTIIGYTDEPMYIRVLENGSISPTKGKTRAIGIAYDKIAYNLLGNNEIIGAEIVSVSEFKTEELVKLTQQNTANLDYISMMTGVDLPLEIMSVEENLEVV